MSGRSDVDRNLSIFHDLATDLLQNVGLDEILRDAVGSAIARLGFQECTIFLMDEDRGLLIEKAAIGEKGFEDFSSRHAVELALGQGIVGHAARDRKSILVADTSRDDRYVRDRVNGASELAVPILLGKELIGVIDSEHVQTSYFTEEHRQLLDLVAALTAARMAHLRSTQSLNETLEELTRTEKQLRDSSKFIREIIDTAPNVLYVLDYREKLMIEGMEKFASFLGYEVDDISDLDHGVYSLVHPDDIAAVEAQEEEQLRQLTVGAVVTIEFRLRHKTEGWRWCLVSSKNFKHDADGTPTMGIGSVHDITEMKRISDELREREERSRGLFENCFDCIVLYDGEGNCRYASPSIERFTGWSDHEVVGRNAMEFVYEDDVRDSLATWYELVKQPGGHAVLVQRIRRKDGELVWIEARLTNRLNEPSVNGIVSNFHDITERKRSEEYIFRLANYDTLTGLPNRRMMMESTENQLLLAEDDDSLTLLYVDLDRFKNVNDTLGHDIGDNLLSQAAAAMKACIQPAHAFGRLGGDEFAVAMSCVDVETATELAAKMIESLQMPFEVDGYEIRITASIGIARYPDSAADSEELFKHADIAMYRAKQERNRYWLFKPADAHAMHERVELEHALETAIERNEFHLEYQPRFDLDSGRIIAVEALLRWRNNRFGAVSPGDFIPVAEETGQIYRIGEWVMETACQQIETWCEQGVSIRVAINLSAHELQRGDLVRFTGELLKRHRIPKGRLELELTETAAMRDFEYSLKVLEDLSEMGIYLSIDDFGTGYSSLSYLQKLPVNCLKVDQSFLPAEEQFVDGAPPASSLMEGIVGLARQVGLSTVAEGVETEQQLTYVRSIGCTEGQGFLMARPMAADAVLDLENAPPPSIQTSVES